MEIEHIDVAEAIVRADGPAILLDVREQGEWDAGHAPQAVLLPLSTMRGGPVELDEKADYLVICHSGQRSLMVTEALVDAGYSAVNVLGGMTAWEQAGGPVVRTDA